MAPGYLTYLETRPGLPTMGALLRLAGVLQTTPDELLGGRVAVPPGQGAPAAHPRLVELGPEECWRLIRPGGVGRVVVPGSPAPAAILVNYTLHEDAVVFRTASGTTLTRHLDEPVGFEVDHVDEAMKEGWSVLVTGQGHLVDAPASSRAGVSDTEGPWAGGRRDVSVRLRVDTITGRRIHAH